MSLCQTLCLVSTTHSIMVSEFEAEKKIEVAIKIYGEGKRREKLFLAANVRPTGNESDSRLGKRR